MIRNPDMVIADMQGKELVRPDWHKVFIMGGADSKIHQHECLYEGKEAYQKLYDHAIFAQITVKGNLNGGIEHTPTDTYIHPLIPRSQLMVSNKLWRYLNLFKFEDLIKSRSLYFSRLDQFPDKLEGISPFSCIEAIKADSQKNHEQKEETARLYKIRMENNRRISFACCWHINDGLNFNMWDEYAQNPEDSVCIQTNVAMLNKVLRMSSIPFIEEPVRYFTEPYFNQNVYWFPTLFKRREYEHEQEFRTIMFVHGCDLKGIRININPEDLIRKIYIHPMASKEFFKKMRILIKNNDLKIPVAQYRPK